MGFCCAWPIADEATIDNIFAKMKERGYVILDRERSEALASGVEVCISHNQQRADLLTTEGAHRGVQICIIARVRSEYPLTNLACSLLQLL